MKRSKLIVLAAAAAISVGLGGCGMIGWSVSSGFDGTPDVGLYLNGGGYYGGPYRPTPPPPPPPGPAPVWGGPWYFDMPAQSDGTVLPPWQR